MKITDHIIDQSCLEINQGVQMNTHLPIIKPRMRLTYPRDEIAVLL